MNQFASRRTFSRTGGALLIAGFLTMAGCSTEGGTQLTGGPDAPPALPAPTSMDVDFGLFQSGGSESTLAAYADPAELGAAFSATQLHFGAAALSVLTAQLVTVLHLAIPTAVFGAAANNTPSFEEDNRWHWRYSASSGGQLWTAHLSGAVDGNLVSWDMRITAPNSNPPLDEFLWYGGTSRTDETSGTWRFYDPQNPSGSSEVARVDWTHESADVHGVTITVTGGETIGDVLSADHDGNARFVTWTDASRGETVEIFWDAATGEGYIIAPALNGGVMACWDSAQQDVPCS